MRLFRKMGSCLLTGVLGISIIGTGSSAVIAQDAVSGQYENIGAPLKRVVGVGGASFDGPDGTPYVSASVNGSPAQFVSVNALTLQVDKVIEIPGTSSAPSMLTGSDGNVYIGTTGTAELFRYVPGSDDLESLGKPVPGETYIYGLANGPDGKLYGGTYPRGRLFELDTATGAVRTFGTLVPGEQYIRQLEYDKERGVLYVGTGTGNKLVEFDPLTGTVSDNWMPAQYATEQYSNTINLIQDKLFIQMNRSSKLVVMDRWTKEIEYERTGVSQHVVASPDGTKAYFFTPGDAYAYSYDLATKEVKQLFRFGRYNGWKSVRIMQTGTEEAPAYTLAAWAGYNAAVRYDFATGTHRGQSLDVPGQPIEIRSIAGGPDGRIYVSGTQGGVGIYDPAKGAVEAATLNISQSEGITAIGNTLYFGVYPQARLSFFDTSRPVATGNPAEIAKFPEDSLQDRPFGMAGSEEHNKLFIGTVPQYGQIGGAFGIFDPVSRKLQTIRNLVEDQSISTLAYKDGKVYGGTSIWGAYGAPAPTAKEGKLFVWDVASGQKELEITPVAGKTAVTSVIAGPDGNIWGFDEGVLFIFDPATQTVTEQHDVIPVKYGGTIWTDAFMVTGKDGNVYGTARGSFFRINGVTKEVTILDTARQFSNLTQDRNGDLYMRSSVSGKTHELWKYTNPDLSLAGLRELVKQLGEDGSLAHPIFMQLNNDLSQTIHHWSNGRKDETLYFMHKMTDVLEKGSEWASAAVREKLKIRLNHIVTMIEEK